MNPRRLLPQRRWVRAALVIVALLVLALGVDVAVLNSRIDTFAVRLPDADDDVETWVLVGSDSRSETPPGAPADQFGTAEQVPGERADLIVVLTIRDGRSAAVSIPRDLLVTSDGYPMRLGMTFQDGPQQLVDSLCASLGIPADHLVGLHFDGFVAVVDALGGIEVTTEHPMRDPLAGLDLPEAGRQQLSGAQALALVRSRSAELLVNGSWQPSPDGVTDRASWSGAVLGAVLEAVHDRRANPVLLQRIAWAATGALRTDPATGLLDLVGLAGSRPQLIALPHDPPAGAPPPGGVLPLPPNADTAQTLGELGLGGPCRPAA